MPTSPRTPFPRRVFLPRPNSLPPPQRVVYLINTRQKLRNKYRTSYHGVVTALEALRSETDPVIANLTAEQQSQIEKALLEARDEVARGFTQTIKLFENTANELVPGTFPRGAEPFGSFDLGEWIEGVCEWLADLLDDLADVFDDFGLDFIGDGLRAAGDGVEWLGGQASEVSHPEPERPEPQPE